MIRFWRRAARADDLTITAYHEAGHAVVAYLVHRRFLVVSILPEPLAGAAGYITLDPPLLDLESGDQRLIEREVMVRLAGLAAEARYAQHDPWQSTRGDMPQAKAMVAFLPHGADDPNPLQRLYLQTLALLEQHWAAVEVVAATLLVQGELGEGVTRQLIRQVLAAAPP